MSKPASGRQRFEKSDGGDTLIEVLIALVVISLAVVAVMGGLVTSITASAEQRNLSALDTLLKSFAESAKYQIDEQASPLFDNCARAEPAPDVYHLLATPSPASGPTLTPVTVFGTGFTPGASSFEVTMGGVEQTVSGSTTSAGNATVDFAVPASLAAGSYPITVSERDGANSVTGSSEFRVTSGPPSANTMSPYAGYSVGITDVENWDNPFVEDPTCQYRTQIQQITATAIAPDNAASDTLSFVVSGLSASQLAFDPSSPGPGTAGVAIPNVSVSLENLLGNVVGTTAGSVTVS
ncbi:MAG TPA: type II secretion system protein, partial [Acidimicrobiales bacterium]|nr:type II secretion system protein [Acidimicrobiales bacterium]